MLTKKQLQWIAWEAGESMVMNGNLDINHAALELRVAAERFLALLNMPSFRPIQDRYDSIMRELKPCVTLS